MNNKIKAEAERRYGNSYKPALRIDAFWDGATFALKEMEQLREAAKGILEIGKRDMSNPKYDGYFTELRAALSATESYFETNKI